jgi:uncharacterized membrane protein YecN with MAPEG domain
MTALTMPVVSAATAGVLIIFQMLLFLTVALSRQSNRQSLGDGGHEILNRKIRRHGNLAENAALFIAGFTLFEIMGGDRLQLEIMCAVFVACRLLHALGLSLKATTNILRFVGALGTVVVGVALGVGLIRIALPHLHGLIPGA